MFEGHAGHLIRRPLFKTLALSPVFGSFCPKSQLNLNSINMTKVAVVTGSNKGIGFAVVKGLCQRFNGVVYLTSRDTDRGLKAVQELEALGLNPKFHQLDITDRKSIDALRDFIQKNHGGLDILINNAAFAFKRDSTESVAVKAEETLKVNYFGVLDTCNSLLPIMNKGGRVLNLTSSLGHLSVVPSKELRREFAAKTLTVDGITNLANRHIEAAKSGTSIAEGWGTSSYHISKVAVCALTFALQREWDSKGIILNCIDPGYVKTDMTAGGGFVTADRGAQSTLFAALDAPDSLKGAFISDNNDVIEWDSDTPPKLSKE